MEGRRYQIVVKDNQLTLTTLSFRAEKGSILHSGIFSRELASFLAAGALLVLLGFFFAYRFRISAFHFITAVILFALLSIFFRSYVFHETTLEVIFDKGQDLVTSRLKKFGGAETNVYPLSALTGISLGHKIFKPQNPDGIKAVEAIALQHGTVIPRFGEAMEFNTVEMDFKQEASVVIFASEMKEEAEIVADKLNKFLEV